MTEHDESKKHRVNVDESDSWPDRRAAELRSVPEATVARLAIYLRVLNSLAEMGVATVSSQSLSVASGVKSATLRKDLSYLGPLGVRGVGYDAVLIASQIQTTMGLDQNRAVALIGVGHLGQALAGYAGFVSRGFRIAALLDADPATVGTRLRGLVVQHVDALAEAVSSESISMAVIAVPAAAAQPICDRLVAVGVTSILNFAPCVLAVPSHVDVRRVDLAAELQILSFHDYQKSGRTAASGTAATIGVSP
jgi:redox-sensing transcriptional repressor